VGNFVGKNFSTGMLLTEEQLDVEILLPSQIFSVTVSSNEAQHILIEKSSTQQVLTAISPVG
jgi:hypothetical protein